VERTPDHDIDAAMLDASRSGGRGSLVVVTTSTGLASLNGVLASRRRFENLTVVVVDDVEPELAVGDIRYVWTPSGEAFPDHWAQAGR
jgi:hypothetical protein